MLKTGLFSCLALGLFLFASVPAAAQETDIGDIAGETKEADLVSLSLGKIRLKHVIVLFSHMSAFKIAYDPQIIPDVKVNIDVTDMPWTTLIEGVLADHNLTLTKRGPGDYSITPPSPSEATVAAPPVDWKGAKREHIRLRQIVSQGSRKFAVLDQFGLVESGSTISAPFGAHVYTWRVNVNKDAISLRRDAVKRRDTAAGSETKEPPPSLEESVPPNGKAAPKTPDSPATEEIKAKD